MALNELLSAFPPAQGWVPLTWHPGSLLRGIPFKKIICQPSYPPLPLFVPMCPKLLYVTPSVSLCPLPSSGFSHPLSPSLTMSPPPTRLTIFSQLPHHLLFRHFAQCSDSPAVESDGGSSSSGLPWGADSEFDMFKRDHSDRKWRREEKRQTYSKMSIPYLSLLVRGGKKG